MIATSKIVPTLSGKVVRWVDDNHFIIKTKGREVLCQKDEKYWTFSSEED